MDRPCLQLSYFAWFLLIIFCGLTFFISGFLLRKVTINSNNTCTGCAPSDFYNHNSSNCLPTKFTKAIVLIVDALRSDFAIYDNQYQNDASQGGQTHFYKNKMPIFKELLETKEFNSALFTTLADPPTTTLQRLKAVTTGGLPTFIDISSNFGGSEIEEDSIIRQLSLNKKHLVFMGDDTWEGLYPGSFTKSYPFPSFNVKDLHTVDNGIIQHLIPQIKRPKWDVIIAHFLGVDHCGHCYGPSHPEMAQKLEQIDSVIRNVTLHMPKNSVLFVLGDHGMTKNGDHGGESFDEISSILFVYSPSIPLYFKDERETVLAQIDFVPTFSLLLGIPIPFSNIGAAVPSLFFNTVSVPQFCQNIDKEMCVSLCQENDLKCFQTLGQTTVLRLNSIQVLQYLVTYNKISKALSFGFMQKTEDRFHALEVRWKNLHHSSNSSAASDVINNLLLLQKDYYSYLKDIKKECEKLWAKFDSFSIIIGLILLIVAIACGVFVLNFGNRANSFDGLILVFFFTTSLVCILIFIFSDHTNDFLLNTCILVPFVLAIAFLFYFVLSKKFKLSLVIDSTSQMTLLTFVVYVGSFFSNSFVVYEDSAVCFIVQMLVIVIGFRSIPAPAKDDSKLNDLPVERKNKKLSLSHHSLRFIVFSALFFLITRVGKEFHKCREEMGPHCESSTYLTPLSSISEEFHQYRLTRLFLSCFVIILMVVLIFVWLKYCKQFHGESASLLCLKYGIPFECLFICFHWILSLAPSQVLKQHLHGHQEILPKIVFCLSVVMMVMQGFFPLLINECHMKLRNTEDKVTALATTYSSSLIVLCLILILPMFLIVGDGLAFSLLLLGFSAFIYIFMNTFQPSNSTIKVPYCHIIVWSFLASHGFFTTGHQHSFSAISWHSAFVGVTGENINVFIQGPLVILNTFATHFLIAMALPLLLTLPYGLRATCSFREKPKVVDDNEDDDETLTYSTQQGELFLFENPTRFKKELFSLMLRYILIHVVKLLFTALACSFHRRHLMVWKIFTPRFVFEVFGFGITVTAVIISYLYTLRTHQALRTFLQKQAKNILMYNVD